MSLIMNVIILTLWCQQWWWWLECDYDAPGTSSNRCLLPCLSAIQCHLNAQDAKSSFTRLAN